MKTTACLLSVLLLLIASGCSTPLPKDSALIGSGTLNVNTMSGTTGFKGALLTGKAATPENVKAAIQAVGEAIK